MGGRQRTGAQHEGNLLAVDQRRERLIELFNRWYLSVEKAFLEIFGLAIAKLEMHRSMASATCACV